MANRRLNCCLLGSFNCPDWVSGWRWNLRGRRSEANRRLTMNIGDLINWFAGGTGAGRYMTLYHCMRHDVLWVTLTVTLDIAVAGGYVLIAFYWWKNQRNLQKSPAKTALSNMKT